MIYQATAPRVNIVFLTPVAAHLPHAVSTRVYAKARHWASFTQWGTQVAYADGRLSARARGRR